MRYGKPVRGRVDGGRGRPCGRCRRKGTSLLAVGVTAVDGGFAAGDAVELVGPDGRPFAVGIAEPLGGRRAGGDRGTWRG